MSKTLCIGGPLDGKRVERRQDNLMFIHRELEQEMEHHPSLGFPMFSVKEVDYIYHKEMIQGQYKRFFLYVLDSITIDDMISLLIDRYELDSILKDTNEA